MPAARGAEKNVLVFGDSISAAYGMNLTESWTQLIAQKLRQHKPGYSLENDSISGETSAGGLARITQALARVRPSIVLLELGANDGLRGLSAVELKHNLADIVKLSQDSGAKVLLLGMKIPPNYGKRYIDLFYQVYPQLAAKMQLPLAPFILDGIADHPELMQADGLHPNTKAQPLIAGYIWRYLEPLLD